MRSEGVPATPENYQLWYTYYSGANSELNRTIDIIMSNQRAFSNELCEELHEQFFDGLGEAEKVLDASGKVEDTIEQIIGNLETAGHGTAAYGEALEGFTGVLESDDTRTVRDFVSHILSATKQIEQQNSALEDQLAMSSNEISQLREDLERVRHEAMTDALTGIGNRKYFDNVLRECAVVTMEQGDQLCLLLLDIDHFKAFNDNYGHQFGDQVLRLVARILQESVKGRDIPCRYGGEEFAILLPSTELRSGIAVAENIREAVAAKKIVRRSTGEELSDITISIGVAEFVYGEPLPTLLERADAALYAAKQAGRNRVLSERDLPASAAATG